MYPIYLRLTAEPGVAAQLSLSELESVGERARRLFPNLEHIRIGAGDDELSLILFVTAESSADAISYALSITNHMVETFVMLRGFRPPEMAELLFTGQPPAFNNPKDAG
jgi:hypothetical protein